MEILACIIGASQRKRGYMFHLAHGEDEIRLVYPFWIVRGAGDRPILIDTGFAGDVAAQRGVGEYLDPGEAMRRAGILPEEIELIVVSHLHYDHFGVPERFPNAVFAIQREDVDYYCRRGLRHPMRNLGDDRSLRQLEQLRADGRIRELDGETRLAPGVRTVLVGGHSPGMQITVCDDGAVRTVIACDASHFYANLETRTPTALIYDYEAYQRGFETIERESGGGHWYPGHDPAMLERLESVGPAVYRVPRRS